MATYDVSTGLSQGLSGAAAGSAIAPGIGTAIGGAVGLASGFLGGNDGSDIREQAIDRNRQALSRLTERRDEVLEEGPTDTEFFNAGASQLQEQAQEQADADAAQAAARGLTGSQFEVAQDQARAETRAEGLRSLLTEAERIDNRNEQQARQAVQQQRQSLNALISDQARATRAQQQGQNAAVRQTFQNLPFVLSQADFSGLDFGFGARTRPPSRAEAMHSPPIEAT